MTHCPSCGKIVEKPQRKLQKHSFRIEAYNCGKCHHNFRITINQAIAVAM